MGSIHIKLVAGICPSTVTLTFPRFHPKNGDLICFQHCLQHQQKKHTNTHIFLVIYDVLNFWKCPFILEGQKLRSPASDLIHQMSLLIHDVTLRLLFDSLTMTLVGNDSHFTSRFSFYNPTTSWNESSQHQPSSVKRHNHYGQPLVDHCTLEKMVVGFDDLSYWIRVPFQGSTRC